MAGINVDKNCMAGLILGRYRRHPKCPSCKECTFM
jgi:hypothetical protein